MTKKENKELDDEIDGFTKMVDNEIDQEKKGVVKFITDFSRFLSIRNVIIVFMFIVIISVAVKQDLLNNTEVTKNNTSERSSFIRDFLNIQDGRYIELIVSHPYFEFTKKYPNDFDKLDIDIISNDNMSDIEKLKRLENGKRMLRYNFETFSKNYRQNISDIIESFIDADINRVKTFNSWSSWVLTLERSNTEWRQKCQAEGLNMFFVNNIQSYYTDHDINVYDIILSSIKNNTLMESEMVKLYRFLNTSLAALQAETNMFITLLSISDDTSEALNDWQFPRYWNIKHPCLYE